MINKFKHYSSVGLPFAALLFIGTISLAVQCRPYSHPGHSAMITAKRIYLKGPITDRDAEISGLAWFRDQLVLLPQYPARFYRDRSILFTLKKADLIKAIVQGLQHPLEPEEMLVNVPDMNKLVPGFEGFESLTFIDNNAYLTIEAKQKRMTGYIIKGRLNAAATALTINRESLREIKTPSPVSNASDESIVAFGNTIITIYEGNGININAHPEAHVFDRSLTFMGKIPFPSIEYRITDATAPDRRNRFWAINYFWSGEKDQYKPGPDRLAAGPSSRRVPRRLERLVCFVYKENHIELAPVPPLDFRLHGSVVHHNWEGLARLNNTGFLIVTDRHPKTVLAFVPYTEKN